jgi:phosphate transport system protein
MNDHTVTAFDDDLNRLRGLVSEMGGRAVLAIEQAIHALDRRDRDAAARIVVGDGKIDELETEIERLVVQTIALRAPMADDLRTMVAALKIAAVLERCGDYAKSIAKRIPLLSNDRAVEAIPLLNSMSEIVCEMLRDVLGAYAAQDAEAAKEVSGRDKSVDDFYNAIFRALITYMMENPRSISESAHLLFVAKNLERAGDHATNIAEMVYFAATGQHMDEREKGEDVSASTEQD